MIGIEIFMQILLNFSHELTSGAPKNLRGEELRLKFIPKRQKFGEIIFIRSFFFNEILCLKSLLILNFKFSKPK